MHKIDSILQSQIDITNTCNLNCKHCRASANTIPDNIDYNSFKKIINELVNNGVKRLTISGGEPFLNKDIFKILSWLKKNKYLFDYIGITSNGYFYNKYFWDNIEEYKDIVNIQISIDGFKKQHNLNRGKSNAFQKTLENVKKLLSVGIHTSVNITVNENNIDEIDDLINYLVGLGINHIAFRHEIPSGRSNFRPDFEFKKKYLLLLTKYFCRLNNEFKGIKFASGDPIRIMVDSDFLKGENIKDIINGNIIGGCSVGVVTLYFNSEKKIGLCPYLDDIISTYKESIISTLWNDEKIFGSFRNREKLEGNCGVCKWKWICGGCRAVPKSYENNILGGDKFCLFGFDEKKVFMSYLERIGILDKIDLISEKKIEGGVYIPFWVQTIVNFDGKNSIDEIITSSWAKRDIKEIKKRKYNYIVSSKREDLIWFYKNLYIPYLLDRYTERELIIMPFFFFDNLFKNDGKILFVVDENNNRLGGYLLAKKIDKFYISIVMGLKNNLGKKNFVSSALYYFILDWALKNKLDKVSFGKTRLYKEDGILKFKEKWGVNTLEYGKNGVYIKFRSDVYPEELFYM